MHAGDAISKMNFPALCHRAAPGSGQFIGALLELSALERLFDAENFAACHILIESLLKISQGLVDIVKHPLIVKV